MCELANLLLRKELEGVSFAPLLDNRNLPWKKAVFSQFLRDGIWIAPDGVAYMGRCIRTHQHRYVEWKPKDGSDVVARELYDLDSDPQENNNIAEDAKHRELIQSLAKQLKAGWNSPQTQTPPSK